MSDDAETFRRMEIGVLNVQPGDTIVVRLPFKVTDNALRTVQSQIGRLFGPQQ
jgi:hypothetical protein